jgi:DNA replication licensing factor MCM5
VRDIRNVERDKNIARHVLGVHVNASMSENNSLNNGEISAPTLKKYITYCRERYACSFLFLFDLR